MGCPRRPGRADLLPGVPLGTVPGRLLATRQCHVGPNLVASVVQWALIAIVVALLYPPARRAIEKFAQRHVESIKDHVSAEHAAVHAKMDHIIKFHPDIPDFPARENDGGES